MKDIVIDTNVLLHTANPSTHYHNSAIETLELILKKDLLLCVDDVFDIDTSKNTSVIGHEYITHARTGSFGYYFLLNRVKEEKLNKIIKANHKDIKKKFSKMLISREIKNRHDITFLVVAYASNDKILVSNDNDDFNDENREILLKKFNISILDSDEYSITYKGVPKCLNANPTPTQAT